MATKTETKLAYEAGRANVTEPADRSGPDACPFPPESEERESWLDGLSDALDEQPDPAKLKAKIKEARA